jgi:hypothetical protein
MKTDDPKITKLQAKGKRGVLAVFTEWESLV